MRTSTISQSREAFNPILGDQQNPLQSVYFLSIESFVSGLYGADFTDALRALPQFGMSLM
jgi:hypothetical protein